MLESFYTGMQAVPLFAGVLGSRMKTVGDA